MIKWMKYFFPFMFEYDQCGNQKFLSVLSCQFDLSTYVPSTYVNLHKSEWKVCQWFLGKLPRADMVQAAKDTFRRGARGVHTKFFCSRMVAQNVLQTKVFVALFLVGVFLLSFFAVIFVVFFVAAHWRRILELVAVKRVFISFCKSQVFIFL